MGRADGAHRIKEAVWTVIGRLQERREASAGPDPITEFKNILTKGELEHIKVNYFNKGIIYAHVDSSPWLYTCALKKDTYLKQVRLSCPAVQDIRFRIGDVHEKQG